MFFKDLKNRFDEKIICRAGNVNIVKMRSLKG